MIRRAAWESCRTELVLLGHSSSIASPRSSSNLQHAAWFAGLAGEESSLLLPPPPPPGAAPRSFEPWRHAGAPIERAATPPSSWYTQPEVLQLEAQTVFGRSWLAVAHAGQLAAPGGYAAGSLLGLQWLACRDETGQLRAFHNVCRHHAAILAPQGNGTASCFRCCYHGWTYGLDGRLLRATRLKGIQEFRAADHGLLPLQAEEWGGLVWVRQEAAAVAVVPAGEGAAVSPNGTAGQDSARQQQGQWQQQQQGVAEWLGQQGSAAALAAGMADPLVHVASREYELNCNWKVFCDNYLDGGYHVSVAHPELASGLDLPSYRSTLYERLSIQTCQPAAASRENSTGASGAVATAAAAVAGVAVTAAAAAAAEGRAREPRSSSNINSGSSSGSGGSNGSGALEGTRQRRLVQGRPPAYVFIYPNLMLNRYGPWLDVNTVVPLGPDRCKVLFDYYLEPGLARDSAFIEDSLAASDRVQQEDVALCESVQHGLASPGYDVGRYAPGAEGPMFHFHQLLNADLQQAEEAAVAGSSGRTS